MKLIEVYANPYIALDADGVPQGVVDMPGSRGHQIGAFLDLALSEKTGKTRYYFPKRSVKVPMSTAISNAVREGALIAADEESARLCGVRDEYKTFGQALADERAKAVEYWRSLGGKDATVGDVPTEACKDDPTAETNPGLVRLTPTVALKSADQER